MRDFPGYESSVGGPPPAWAPQFRSDDLDEVRETVARTDGEHSRVAHSAGRLGYEVAWLHGATVSMAWALVALPTTLRGELPTVVLHLGIPPGSWYRFGRREYEIRRNDALFIADRWEFTRHAPPGASFAIDLHKDALIEEIAARGAGRPGRPMLTTRPLAFDDATRARLLAVLASLVQARAPGVPVQRAQRLEADVLAIVAELLTWRAGSKPISSGRSPRASFAGSLVSASGASRRSSSRGAACRRCDSSRSAGSPRRSERWRPRRRERT